MLHSWDPKRLLVIPASHFVSILLLAFVASGAAAQSPEAKLQTGDWVRIHTADGLLYGLVKEARADTLLLEVGEQRSIRPLAYAGMDALALGVKRPRSTGALRNMAKWSAISVSAVTVTFFLANADIVAPTLRDLDEGTQYGLIFLVLATVPVSVITAGIVGSARPGHTWRDVPLAETVTVGAVGAGLGLRVRL